MPTDFKNSVIKEICYHGTDETTEIKELDKSKIQKDYRDGSDSGYLGWGFYLTTDYDYASEYGDNVLEFFVNLENPFILGETNVDNEELIKFIFSNSGKSFAENLKNSLYILKLFAKGKGGDFENTNSPDLLKRCRELVIKCDGKETITDNVKGLAKDLFIELSKEPNNWLNGLFLYFSKELFHYFIVHGYDGVIADDGREIVVYESNQIKQVNKLSEDNDGIDFDDVKTFYDLKAGDKLKVKDTNDLMTVTGIRDWGDILWVDYVYDEYIEDAPSHGSFKVYKDDDNSYLFNRFEVLN